MMANYPRHKQLVEMSGRLKSVLDTVMARQRVCRKNAVNVISRFLSSLLITLVVFAFGITAKGEWVLIIVHFMRQFNILQEPIGAGPNMQSFSWRNMSLESLHLKGLPVVWIYSNCSGFIMYFLTGGILHWYFYVKQRDRPEAWKCQPKRWLSTELQLDAIKYGSRSLMITSTVTSLLACYIANGGWSTIYYTFNQYSWSWYIAQYPLIFCYQDYMLYLMHRFYHTPWMYKRFHKVHHKYVQPTAFSVTALHPVEIVHMQLVLCIPLFTIPVHWTSFTAIALYTYYHGIIDHSGIDFKAPWWQPWRPDTMFHDNHHQYFHVNFGFNCFYWDKLHGTLRRPDRIYKEDIFYGKGKPLFEASAEELDEEVKERLAENPNAHRLMNQYLNEHDVLKFKNKSDNEPKMLKE